VSASVPYLAWSQDVLFRSAGPDVLLAPPGRDDFELLSGTAGVVWRLLETPRTVAELVDVLADLYGTDRESIATDVHPLIDTLLEQGLIRQAPEGDA